MLRDQVSQACFDDLNGGLLDSAAKCAGQGAGGYLSEIAGVNELVKQTNVLLNSIVSFRMANDGSNAG